METQSIEVPTRASDLETVAAWCRATYLPAEIVGRWVWVRFSSKPVDAVRDELKAAGFRYVAHRQAWAHSCGAGRSRKAPYDPREKYGAVPVADDDET